MAKKKVTKKTTPPEPPKKAPIPRKQIACFSGHRPDKLPGGYQKWRDTEEYKSYRERLLVVLLRAIGNGITHFISGMALGFDQLAVECLLELRAKGHKFTIVAAVPCKNQDSKWLPDAQKHYAALLKACDKVVYVTQTDYTDGCMQSRNKFMVDNSIAVIALWNGSQGGGTANCVKYAMEKNRPIYRIHPLDPNQDGWLKPKA